MLQSYVRILLFVQYLGNAIGYSDHEKRIYGVRETFLEKGARTILVRDLRSYEASNVTPIVES